MAWFLPKPLLVPDIITINVASCPSKDAVVDGDRVVSWSEFGRGTSQFANALHDLGLAHGDRVVVLMTNSYEMIEAMFGVIRGGYCVVPLNCAITDDAVAGMIENSDAKAVVASGEHIALWNVYCPLNPSAARSDVLHALSFLPTPHNPSWSLATLTLTFLPPRDVTKCGLLHSLSALTWTSWYQLMDKQCILHMGQIIKKIYIYLQKRSFHGVE